MKKLAIVGASHFVNRMFEACGNYQWAREFLKNSHRSRSHQSRIRHRVASRRKARRLPPHRHRQRHRA